MAVTARLACLGSVWVVDLPGGNTEEQILSLSLLGSFEARAGDHTVAFATDAVRALLAYLAVAAYRSPFEEHRREFLATLLWPDQSQSAALTNLRQTLARLRRGLPTPIEASLLEITRQTLGIRADSLELDCARFEWLIAVCADHSHRELVRCPACIQRLEEASELYRGEFLAYVFAGSSQLFDEWVFAKREQYHQQALDALHTLADYYEIVSDFAAMRRSAARQLQFEPWREAAHRQMMRALALEGHRTAAIEQFESCRRILADELGIEPDTRTRALFERIRDEALKPEELRAPAPAHNLPAQLTPFVGRDEELRIVNGMLDDPGTRLATLIGAGGMGKTRLALEVASQRLNRYPDGVFFVSLTPVSRPDTIPTATATAMGLTLTGNIQAALSSALRDRRVLLVLDNFEHLVDGAGLIVELLEAAPYIQLIATSRERLNVVSEHVYVVHGMEYSGFDGPGAIQSPAVRLFTHGARRVRPDFTLRDENLPAVMRICELVEGMPLGLELAAAWADMLPLDEIVREIERSVDFLSSNWQDAPERHRSLRAVFESSWRSLDEPERQVFRQLSVFIGGFTRDAAQAVAGASLRPLARLGQKSLLYQRGGRYEIHELLRQFGAEQLDASPEDRTIAEKRHSTYFLRFVAERQDALDRDEPQLAAQEIQVEMDNIEKAWISAIQCRRFADLDASAIALWRFSLLGGSSLDTERLMRHAAEQLELCLGEDCGEPGADTWGYSRILSKLRAIQATALIDQGSYDAALPIAEQAITVGHASGGGEGEALGYLCEARALAQKAQYSKTERTLQQALKCAQDGASGDATTDPLQIIIYNAYLLLGSITLRQHDHERAVELLRRALDICRKRGDLRGEMHSLANLANATRMAHDYARAREYYERALQIAHELSFSWGEATNRLQLGDVVRLQGDPFLASKLIERALSLYREVGDRLREAVALLYLGRLYVYLGAAARSRECLDGFLQIIEEIDAPVVEGWGWLALAIHHLHLDEPEQALVFAEQAVPVARALTARPDYADALAVTGQILFRLSRLDEAAAVYQEAIDVCDDTGRASEVIAARSGLTQISLTRGDQDKALAHVEQILATVGEGTNTGGDQPFSVLRTCYRVLEAFDDPRAANVLKEAHRRLLDYANGIADESLRRSFLENVAANRELQRAYAEYVEHSATDSSTGSGAYTAT